MYITNEHFSSLKATFPKSVSQAFDQWITIYSVIHEHVYDLKKYFTETALTINQNLKNIDISKVSCWFEPCLL